jgi:Txe/YoeB family toxin of toxin-antitoxin system
VKLVGLTRLVAPRPRPGADWIATSACGLLNRLIGETQRDPFAGTGKPEPLQHALSGFWLRRITDEHRVVYRPCADALEIVQLRFHY